MDDKALLQQYRGEIMDLKLKLQTANDVLLQEQKNNQSMLTAERQQVIQCIYIYIYIIDAYSFIFTCIVWTRIISNEACTSSIKG